MAVFPCKDFTPCFDPASPIENLSAEGNDGPTFIGQAWPWIDGNNPVNDPTRPNTFDSSGCVSVCESSISQADADLCAARQAVLCAGTKNGGQAFYSDFQAVSASCADGSIFTFSAAPGAIVVVSPDVSDPKKTAAQNAAAQAAANAAAKISANDQAIAYAQAQAGSHILCLSDLPNGCLNSPYFSTITSSCNLPPVLNFSMVSGSLPNGLSLEQATSNTALLSGTPTTSGNFTFTLHAEDGQGFFQNRVYTVAVIGITNSPPQANVGSAYSFAFTASGGTPPYTYFLASGSLPTGLTLASDGTISGTPTNAETDNFTVSVTDSSA